MAVLLLNASYEPLAVIPQRRAMSLMLRGRVDAATEDAVTIRGDAVEDILLYGHGAGMLPTASAVVGDIADIARDIFSGAENRLSTHSYQLDQLKDFPILPIDEITVNYYFRFSALDSPGVLSTISGILGDHGISIKSVQQKGRKKTGSVPIVMLTHKAKEKAVNMALKEIASLDAICSPPVLIRIEDEK